MTTWVREIYSYTHTLGLGPSTSGYTSTSTSPNPMPASAADEKFISDNVSRDYVQHADGKTLGYDEFVHHIRLLKERSITFKSLAEDGDLVFSNQFVDCTMKDGSRATLHIIAEFRIRDGKMCYCDELSHLVTGDEATSDLGSAY